MNFGKILSIVILTLIFSACQQSKELVVEDGRFDKVQTINQNRYLNEEFGFSLELPKDFKIVYLPHNTGVLLKQWVVHFQPPKKNPKPGEPRGPIEDSYRVEIVVFAFENLEKFDDLNAYIIQKYSDYSFEFKEFENVSGFYVDESLDEAAKRHFFTMSENGKIFYEAYLKVPSLFYESHKGEFEDVVKSLKIF